ncbi:MAG TPA: hypothetical protein VII97_00950 [Anaerolineales bacterium]
MAVDLEIRPSARRVTGIDPDMGTLQAAVTTRPDNLRQTISFVRACSLDLPFPHEQFAISILAWAF